MHFPRKHITITLISYCFISFIQAQIIGAKAFAVNDDASSRILCLVKHSKGFLMAGTNNGIYRFTGNSFHPFRFNDTIKNRAVTAIAETGSDTIWLGFQTGEIGYIKNNIVQLLAPEEGYPKVAVTSILQDKNGTIFFATAGEGIYYYFNKRFYNINVDDGLSDNYVYDIKLSNNTRIIAGTDHGVNICTVKGAKKSVTFFASNHGIPDNIVRSLAPAEPNSFFIGMQDRGIGIFELGSHSFHTLNSIKDWLYQQVNSIIKTVNEVWVGTENKGLIRVAGNSIAPANLNNEVAFSKINHLTEDNEGNIWFTSNNQLVKTSGAQIQNIIPFSNDLFPQVHCILSATDHSIWINDNNGLLHYTLEDNKWQVRRHILPAINKTIDITSLYQDKYGNIWIGTMGKGVIVLDPISSKTRSITEHEVLIGGSILSINGRDDHVWISSLSGAIRCQLSKRIGA
jgi:ligand-binding sensor domain-containing protein